MGMAASNSAPASFKPDAPTVERVKSRSILRRAWLATSSALAAGLGVAPHVLHHAGPLAGAALFAGAGGSLLFGGLGFLLAIPFLMRLHKRFGNWRAPLAALVLLATVFSISTFVIGPAITQDGDDGASDAPRQERQSDQGHDAHH
jgi:hypothetical protein